MTTLPLSIVVIAAYDNGDEEVLRLEVLGGAMQPEKDKYNIYLVMPDEVKKGRKVLKTYMETGF